jgi:hypothetical protein
MGADGEYRKDAMGISGGKDYIFDNVSISWGWDGTLDVNGDGVDNLTFQDCIIGQGIDIVGHSTGGLMETGKWSVIRSLYIDNVTRNPKAKGKHEFINSVLYNWAENGFIMGGNSTSSAYSNMIGNYFIYGPSSNASTHFTGANSLFNVYGEDNWVDSNKDGMLNGTLITNYTTATVVDEPYDYPGVNEIMTADSALKYVIQNVGGSYPARDAVDELLIQELTSYGIEGQIIVTEEDNGIPGNVGIIANGTPPTDTDQDGMPDFWEDANSLDKDDPADRNGDDDSDGFTNLEEYLNSIIGDTMYVPPPPVSPPSIDVSYSYDDASVFLQWVSNNFVNVVSVQLYQSESDDLSDPQIYSLEKSQDTLTIESLTRGTTYYFAFSITDSSSFESFVSDTIAVVPNKTFTTQAEDASHIGIVFVDDNHIGFHGTAFTNFDASNSAVEFTNMPGYAGGECTLLYRYALGNSDRTGSLTVNGKTSSLTMHNTGDWANWVLDSVKINLNPGYDNTIRFSATGSDFGNLDEITIVPENLTSIESENNSEALSQFELYQNYPNPFNPITTINFTIPKASHVTLVVFDMLGKEVDKLVDEQKKPGAYSAIFNAENLASGIYFYKLQAGDIILVKKSVLLK